MPEYKNPGRIQFKAKMIEADGGGAYVEFPHDVETTFGVKGRVPIKAKFDGVDYRGSLYHLWIEGAKRAETRSNRIEQMIEKLEANQKLK